MAIFSVSHFPSRQVAIAQSVFDTAAPRSTLKVRSAATASKQMLFEVDGAEVVLQVLQQPASGHWRVMGQVLDEGAPSEAAGIELLGPYGEIARMTDDDGEFQFDALPKGSYSLTVGTSDLLFHAPALVLE